MSLFQRHPRKDQGFSLIEMLIVMAVIAALTVAAFIVYPKVRTSNIAKEEAEYLFAATASIKEMFPAGDYSNLTDQVAIDAKIFPENMLLESTIQNRFGGRVMLRRTDRSPKLFRIDYQGTPSNVCVKLLPLLAQRFKGVSVKGEDGKTYIARDDFGYLRPSYHDSVDLDEESVAKGCYSSSGTAGTVLIFDF